MITQTTFEILNFENWPPPEGAKTKMDFHVSLGFLGYKRPLSHSASDTSDEVGKAAKKAEKEKLIKELPTKYNVISVDTEILGSWG